MLLLCSGCTLFRPSGEQGNVPAYSYINQTRFHAITASGKFICLIDQERPPTQQTIRDIIKIAKRSALTVDFRPVPHSLRIPSLLRAGKADAALGNYKTSDAQEKQLDCLTIRNALCLLRKDDTEWKRLLASGIAILDTPDEKK
jgi:hypothetical protein